MSRTKRLLLLGCLAIVLGYALIYALDKERTLRSGQLVLLQLAPVDPRSLLQGDYMDLRYELLRYTDDEVPDAGETFAVVRLDENGVGYLVRMSHTHDEVAAGEYALRVERHEAGLWNRSGLHIGADSYFFEEGKGEVFSRAAYGGLRLDGRGGAVLAGLYDTDFTLLE